MISHKSDAFGERLTTAARAKEAMLERFRARPGPNDPAVVAQAAARKAISEARDTRNAARKAASDIETARLKSEAATKAEEQRALAVQQALEAEAAAKHAAELPALQKAARDARYAARKARQG